MPQPGWLGAAGICSPAASPPSTTHSGSYVGTPRWFWLGQAVLGAKHRQRSRQASAEPSQGVPPSPPSRASVSPGAEQDEQARLHPGSVGTDPCAPVNTSSGERSAGSPRRGPGSPEGRSSPRLSPIRPRGQRVGGDPGESPRPESGRRPDGRRAARCCPLLLAPAAPPGPDAAFSSRTAPGGLRRPSCARCRRSPRAAVTGRGAAPARPRALTLGRRSQRRRAAGSMALPKLCRRPAPRARRSPTGRAGTWHRPGADRDCVRPARAPGRPGGPAPAPPGPRRDPGISRCWVPGGGRHSTDRLPVARRARVAHRGAGRVPPRLPRLPLPVATPQPLFLAPVPDCPPQTPSSLSSLSLPSQLPSPCSPHSPASAFWGQGHPRDPTLQHP